MVFLVGWTKPSLQEVSGRSLDIALTAYAPASYAPVFFDLRCIAQFSDQIRDLFALLPIRLS